MKNTMYDKITMLRPLLIFLVVTTHIQGNLYRPDLKNIELTIENFLNAFLSGTIAISALPLLSVISGYLAASTYKKYKYICIVEKKIYRILIPMIAWNLILAIYIYQSQRAGFPRRPDLILYPAEIKNWIFGLLGLFTLPANQPLYFLKELFLCFMLLPVFNWISKCNLLTIFILVIISYMSIKGINFNFFHRIDIYGFFIIGLFIYNNKNRMELFDFFKNKKHQIIYILIYFILAVLLTLYAFKETHSNFIYYMKIMTVLGPLAFWFSSSYIKGVFKKILIWISPVSFPVFLGHILILNVYWGIWTSYFKTTPISENYWIYWISSFIICFVFMGLMYFIYNKIIFVFNRFRVSKCV